MNCKRRRGKSRTITSRRRGQTLLRPIRRRKEVALCTLARNVKAETWACTHCKPGVAMSRWPSFIIALIVVTAGESAPELHFPQSPIQHLMYQLYSFILISPVMKQFILNISRPYVRTAFFTFNKSKNLSNIQNKMFSCKLLQEFKNNQEKLILYPIF